MYLHEDGDYPVGTLFYYPRPLDGQTRQFLQGDVKNLLHKGKIDEYRLLDETLSLTVSFRNAGDQNKFYAALATLPDYNLLTVFSHPQGRTLFISSVDTRRDHHGLLVITGNPSPA